MSEFILYNYFRSSASYRVRIALQIKGIQYEYRPVHLLNQGGEQHFSDYGKLNPSREVPTLIHNNKAIGQSVAIIDYLDQVVPEPPLFDDDAYRRSLILQACEIINSGAQPIHNLRVLKELEVQFSASQEQKEKWCQYWIHYGLQCLERFLTPYADVYSFGKKLSAADCFLIPHLANADRFSVNLAEFPILTKIRTNCQDIPAFQNAAPHKQPDFPG